jgi:predicted DNA-binding protein with PD1-like motif
MKYTTGSIGRIFTIRFDDGDDFLGELTELAKKEDIRAGWFNVIGGLREADVVTGPKEPVMPPEPVWKDVREAKEVLGVGSIFRDENDVPKIHLHTSLGHHGDTMTVCVRKGTKTYLILEVYLIEITGTEITRPWYPEGQFNRLLFEKKIVR